MRYKYERNQIFGKKLKVPQYIINKVYNKTLSFEEFIEYELDGKIPTSCIEYSDRQIVERFGIEKSKKLDWELLNKKLSFKNLLLDIEPSVENINRALYEIVKDQIIPQNYSSQMKKMYSDRLFDLSNNNNEEYGDEMRYFNMGSISLWQMVDNWKLYKDKDLSFCLMKDIRNKQEITDKDLKLFMDEYEDLVSIVKKYNDIYSFIHKIKSLSSTKEKEAYIKKVIDGILEKK